MKGLVVVCLHIQIQAGIGTVDDTNGYKQEGTGPFDLTIHKGERWSTSRGYLWPVSFFSEIRVHFAYTDSLVFFFFFFFSHVLALWV